MENTTFDLTDSNSPLTIEEPSDPQSSNPFPAEWKVPAIIEAFTTLLVCGVLLAGSLLIIKKTRIWCRKHQHLHEDDEEMQAMNAGEDYHYTKGPIPILITSCSGGDLEPTSRTSSAATGGHPPVQEFEESSEAPPASDTQTSMKAPKKIVRRSSGPFNEEALAFVEQTYHKKSTGNKNYEQKESSWVRRSSLKKKGPCSPGPTIQKPTEQPIEEVESEVPADSRAGSRASRASPTAD